MTYPSMLIGHHQGHPVIAAPRLIIRGLRLLRLVRALRMISYFKAHNSLRFGVSCGWAQVGNVYGQATKGNGCGWVMLGWWQTMANYTNMGLLVGNYGEFNCGWLWPNLWLLMFHLSLFNCVSLWFSRANLYSLSSWLNIWLMMAH